MLPGVAGRRRGDPPSARRESRRGHDWRCLRAVGRSWRSSRLPSRSCLESGANLAAAWRWPMRNGSGAASAASCPWAAPSAVGLDLNWMAAIELGSAVAVLVPLLLLLARCERAVCPSGRLKVIGWLRPKTRRDLCFLQHGLEQVDQARC